MPALSQPMMETVLIVDDNAQNRQLVDAQLTSAGYTVTCVGSGEEALALFSRYTPDLVLLDIMMPGLNGFEVFRRLRQLPGGNETPVVFLTAAVDPTTHKTALELGVDDFLSKPINRTELLIRVRSLLRVRRLHTELSHGSALLRTQREAHQRLKRQLEELNSFLTSDLQPPLLHALWLSDQLREQTAKNDAAQPLSRELGSVVNGLLRSLGNVLDVERGEAGLLVPQLGELELGPLISAVWQRQSELARARQQSVQLLSDVGGRKVQADADLLTRLIENLLDHVLRSAPDGADVSLEARVAPDGGTVLLRVYDEGPGVPAEQRDLIFERHAPTQTHGQPALPTRSRIALAFCRLIAESHGGRIFIDDLQPSGSAFCVQLPLAMGYLATAET